MKSESVAPDAGGDKPPASDGRTSRPLGQQRREAGRREVAATASSWGESTTEDNGNTYTGYEVTHEDGSTERGAQTERPDGTHVVQGRDRGRRA